MNPLSAAEAVLDVEVLVETLRRCARDTRALAESRRRRADEALRAGLVAYAEGLRDAASWLDAVASYEEARLAAAHRQVADLRRGVRVQGTP